MSGTYITNELGSLFWVFFFVFITGLAIGVSVRDRNEDKKNKKNRW